MCYLIEKCVSINNCTISFLTDLMSAFLQIICMSISILKCASINKCTIGIKFTFHTPVVTLFSKNVPMHFYKLMHNNYYPQNGIIVINDFKLNLVCGIDFTSKTPVVWDIIVNWFNWQIIQLAKTANFFDKCNRRVFNYNFICGVDFTYIVSVVRKICRKNSLLINIYYINM